MTEGKLLMRIYAYEFTRVNSRKTNFFTVSVLLNLLKSQASPANNN